MVRVQFILVVQHCIDKDTSLSLNTCIGYLCISFINEGVEVDSLVQIVTEGFMNEPVERCCQAVQNIYSKVGQTQFRKISDCSNVL